MRVPIKLRRHNILMLLEFTILSLTLTCNLITHRDSGTMRISHIGEEHNKGHKPSTTLCFTWVLTTITTTAVGMSEGRKSVTKKIFFL